MASTSAAPARPPPVAVATAAARSPSRSSRCSAVDLVRLGEVADHRGRDRAAGAQHRDRENASRSGHADQLSGPQGEPELDPVAGAAEVAAGQLLDAPYAIAQRVAVAVQLLGRSLPVAVLLQERLQRAQQLVAVFALAVRDRPQHAVAVDAQRIVVLDREQEPERTQVL